MFKTAEMTTVGCWINTWGDINPERYRDHVTFDPEPLTFTKWTYLPRVLTVPVGWHVSLSGGGSMELYDQDGKHAAFVVLGSHRKSAQFATSGGTHWFSIDEALAVCCPTCGNPL